MSNTIDSLIAIDDYFHTESYHKTEPSYIEEILRFFEYEEGWNKNELIHDTINEIIKGVSADELTINTEETPLIAFDHFIDQFYDKLVDKFCKVLASFKEEE